MIMKMVALRQGFGVVQYQTGRVWELFIWERAGQETGQYVGPEFSSPMQPILNRVARSARNQVSFMFFF